MPTFLDALDAEIADLERQLSASPIYVKLRRAQELRDAYAIAGTHRVPVAADHPEPVRTGRPSASGTSAAVIGVVRDYLKGKDAPVTTRHLMDVLARNGIEIGGVKPQNSVSSLLSKTPDIISHGRKGWTLRRDTEKAGDDTPDKETSPASVQPSTPVEPGEEVAHDDTLDVFR